MDSKKLKKVKKRRKMVETYNKKAIKWGYPPITIDPQSFLPSPFGYSEANDNGSFWTLIRIAYRDGYMRSDYDKILKFRHRLNTL